MTLYNKKGKAAAYIENDVIWTFDGRAVAYLFQEAVYNFPGKQLGWFETVSYTHLTLPTKRIV